MKTVKSPIKLTLKIKRPNGETETVTHPNLKYINAAQFKQIQAATKAAGKGEVLSYNIEYKTNRVYSSLGEKLNANSDKTVENMSRMGE